MPRAGGMLPLACALAVAGCAGREEPVTAPAADAGAPAAPSAEMATAQAPAAGAQVARLDGFGPLTFGMSIEEAGRAWPGLFNNLPRLAASTCFHANPGDVEFTYFGFMFDDGKFVRYGGGNDAIVAPGGGKRGMGEAQLQALYANALQASPHPFVKGGKLLSLDASGVAPSRLVFETDAQGKVSEWRVGLRPQVDYSEGCESDRD